MTMISVDENLCLRDGICAATCPLGLVQLAGGKGTPTTVAGAEQLCIQCGHCVSVCPSGALSLDAMPVADCPPVRPELALNTEQAEQFLRSRRSIRAYQSRAVERETLTRLLTLARLLEKGTGALMVAIGILLSVPTLVRGTLRTAPAPTLARAVGDHGTVIEPPLGAAAGVPRLVEFYSARCPVCERMKSRIETLRTDCAGRKLEIITLNVSEPRNREAASSWQVSGVPSFVLLREDGSVAERFVGEQALGTLRDATGTLLGTACGDQPHQKLKTTPVGPSCSARPLSQALPADEPPSCGM